MAQNRKFKTKAERDLEREQAVYQHQLRLADAQRGIGKTTALKDPRDPAELLPHPRTNRWFMAVGIALAGFLLFSLVYSVVNAFRDPKTRPSTMQVE